MSVERVDYSNEEEFQQALQQEELESRAQWEGGQDDLDAAQEQAEQAESNVAEAEAMANQPQEDIPF